jgi:hypothetical protein
VEEFLKDADRKVNHLTEDFARRLNRRQLVFKGVKGLAAAAAALSVGSLAGVRNAFAMPTCNCTCTPPQGGNCVGTCNACGYGSCPANGCPSGCYKCRNGDCSSCPYDSASWVCCYGCGTCGNGYRLCYDCRCPTGSGKGCSRKCGCKSVCIGGGGCGPAEVEAEMARFGIDRADLESQPPRATVV